MVAAAAEQALLTRLVPPRRPQPGAWRGAAAAAAPTAHSVRPPAGGTSAQQLACCRPTCTGLATSLRSPVPTVFRFTFTTTPGAPRAALRALACAAADARARAQHHGRQAQRSDCEDADCSGHRSASADPEAARAVGAPGGQEEGRRDQGAARRFCVGARALLALGAKRKKCRELAALRHPLPAPLRCAPLRAAVPIGKTRAARGRAPRIRDGAAPRVRFRFAAEALAGLLVRRLTRCRPAAHQRPRPAQRHHADCGPRGGAAGLDAGGRQVGLCSPPQKDSSPENCASHRVARRPPPAARRPRPGPDHGGFGGGGHGCGRGGGERFTHQRIQRRH